MRCPFCHTDGKDRVIDSRPVEDGQAIRRRRLCENCNRRYTTYERIGETVRLQVVKKDTSRVPFDRNRILTGIQKACYKRPVSAEKMSKIVDMVEDDIIRHYPREVPSSAIGELVMRHLRRLDPIAFVRFASVYREFRDVRQLVDEAQEVMRHARDEDPTQQDLFP